MTAIPDEIVNILKKPLPAEAIKPHPTKSYLSSIKAIYVVERLNEAFGLNGWKIRNELIEIHDFTRGNKTGTMVVMKSFLTVPQYGIEVEAYGGNDNEDRGDAYKGACTDALTKIGSYLYIGMDVYKGFGSNPPARFSQEGERAAQAVAQEKIHAMQGGADYSAVSSHDPRLEDDLQESVKQATPPTAPKQRKPFSMKAWIEEARKIKALGTTHLGSAWLSEYYRIIGIFKGPDGQPAKHANDIRTAKDSRECYKMLANSLDSLVRLKNVTPESMASDPPPRDAFDEHLAEEAAKDARQAV